MVILLKDTLEPYTTATTGTKPKSNELIPIKYIHRQQFNIVVRMYFVTSFLVFSRFFPLFDIICVHLPPSVIYYFIKTFGRVEFDLVPYTLILLLQIKVMNEFVYQRGSFMHVSHLSAFATSKNSYINNDKLEQNGNRNKN